MGLAGQVLVAKRNAMGYAFWIVGNVSLMFMCHGLHQYGLIGLQIVNTAIQLYAVGRWINLSRANSSAVAA
jgi:nicotinamide riboside transporter PnuC